MFVYKSKRSSTYDMTDYVVATSTCLEKDADDIARKLVETKACACVNIIRGLTSVYHWKGEIEVESEAILLMKTEEMYKDKLWRNIKKIHPYEVPEFIVLPIIWGSQDYLDWISASISGTAE
ncbi:MAG: divalent-cation tolerance protein CutA [Candidatus Thorarchaeota archaeon]